MTEERFSVCETNLEEFVLGRRELCEDSKHDQDELNQQSQKVDV
jgi:hypothetical protein